MTIEKRIEQKFTKKSLIDTISRYQLFYQIALGAFVKDTSFDKEEMSKKLEEFELDMELENVLTVMVKIIINFYDDEDNFEDIFDDNVKLNSLLHSLKSFIDKSDDLVNKDKIYDTYNQKIMNDEFFDVKMQIYFHDELKDRKDYWEDLITDEIANSLKESALSVTQKV